MDSKSKEKKNSSNTSDGRWIGRLWAVVEVLLILAVFFLFVSGPPPHDDEAHYLGKAKHYWNPDWCPGDHFFGSADAHLVFNWTIGWLTLYLSLPAVAWIGRVVTWTLLAWSWRRLSWAVVPRRLVSLLTASMFLTLLERCDLAGEWVVGGVEAKGFSFVFVFLGLEALVRQRWRAVWILLGIATSQHVLVGGWSMVAAGFAWLVASREHRPPLLSMLPSMLLAVVLALPGLLPALALSGGEQGETVREAQQLYVFTRLPHHLVIHWIVYNRPWYVVRHVALLVGCLVLFWPLRRAPQLCLLSRFVAGGIVLALIGVLIDQATVFNKDLSASLLRFYWYRLNDVGLPLGAALGVALLLENIKLRRPAAASWSLAGVMLLTTISLGTTIYQRQQDPRPGADKQTLPRVKNDVPATMAIYYDWKNLCRWISENTPPTARFITPHNQQTFKWYSGRSEVVTYKDVPQDAPSLVQWRQRYNDLYPESSGTSYRGLYRLRAGITRQQLALETTRRLLTAAEKYDAHYVIIDRRKIWVPLPLKRVYPNRNTKNASYLIYRLPSRHKPVQP